MSINYESVCVDSSHSTGNPVHRRFGDVDIYHWQTQLHSMGGHWGIAELRMTERLTVMEVFVAVTWRIKYACTARNKYTSTPTGNQGSTYRNLGTVL
jgi:hypothetical protein